MRQTEEQRTATEVLRKIAGPYRVTLDAEGWPQIEAKYGAIEYHEPDTLAVYSQSQRLLRPLLAAGARRHQIGDEEYRLLLSARLLPTVAKVIRCRRRQAPRPGRSREFLASVLPQAINAHREVAESKVTLAETTNNKGASHDPR